MNALSAEASSLPVVSEISRLPSAAFDAMVILTIACVASVTVTLLTAIPAPKLAVVTPCAKWVPLPVSETLRPTRPWRPVGGVTPMIPAPEH